MNNKEDVIKRQYEAWASTYDRDKVEIIRKDTGIELEEFVDHILDNCQLKKGQKILDVGIGTGLISVSISKKLSGNCEILGIDITDAMLAKARNNIKMESLEHTIYLKKASAENIPVKSSFYDLIICVFTLRHTNIERALSEFMRVLRPRGRVVITDLYAPERWRSLSAKIVMPIFKLLFTRKKEMKAEKRSKLLTLEEWKTQAMEIGGREVKIENFPNIDEPEWKPGKIIISWIKE
jgi:ubiquinone/menaquinone biosynthesis C-methylase UbiE